MFPFSSRVALRASLTFAIAALVICGGCGKGSSSTTTGGSSATSSEPVRLGYFANLTHAQAVLGVASGDFQKAIGDAKLQTSVFNAGPSLIEALLANQIDIGYVGPGPALNAYARTKGQGVRVIAGSAANGVLIVARKDAGINQMSDLAGKHLATPQRGNTQDISARHYLQFDLKQKDSENVVPVANAEQAALMARGQIDASWAPEPWGSFLIAQTGAKLIGEEKDLWPDKQFTITLVITTPQYIEKHPDVVRKILAVHQDWTVRLARDPLRFVPDLQAALFALTQKQVPTDVMNSAMKYTTFTTDPLTTTFESYAKWSVDLGVSREKPDLSRLVDASLLPAKPQAAASAPAQ